MRVIGNEFVGVQIGISFLEKDLVFLIKIKKFIQFLIQKFRFLGICFLEMIVYVYKDKYIWNIFCKSKNLEII